MKIKYSKEQNPIRATNHERVKWTLTLTAEGGYEELVWLEKQLSKIGKK